MRANALTKHMDHRLIALKILSTTKSDGGTGLETTDVSYQDIAVNIFLRFIGVLEGVAIIIAGLFLMRIIRRYFTRIETQHERQRTALNLLEKITSGFVIVVSLTLGLKVIGLDITMIVSVLTLGVSFGMRDVIKNYVAGLLILFKSPFEIGDVVNIRKFTGKIEKIEFQAVTLRTFDNKIITIHNSDLLTQPITNFSKSEQARLELNIPLGYGSDVARALRVFDRILDNNSSVLKLPKYSIVFKTFGDHNVNVLVRFWVQKPCNVLRIRSELALQIQEAFDEEKIFAPYSREAQLAGNFGMSEERKTRLQSFYGQPLLANIAVQTMQTAPQIAGAGVPATTATVGVANGDSNGAAPLANVPAGEYADTEEPE